MQENMFSWPINSVKMGFKINEQIRHLAIAWRGKVVLLFIDLRTYFKISFEYSFSALNKHVCIRFLKGYKSQTIFIQYKNCQPIFVQYKSWHLLFVQQILFFSFFSSWPGQNHLSGPDYSFRAIRARAQNHSTVVPESRIWDLLLKRRL